MSKLPIHVVTAMIVYALFGGSCASGQSQRTGHDLLPDTASGDSVVIGLERTDCNGTCPVYTIVIHGSGLVEYFGEMFVKVKGYQTGEIPPDTVTKLVREFLDINYFAYSDDFPDGMTDMPTTFTSIKLGNNYKKIRDYGHAAPEALRKLEQRIDEVANTEQWTGAAESERRYHHWLDSMRIARPDKFKH
jgi:hypothetical protein